MTESSKWYEIGKRAVEGAREGVNIENYHMPHVIFKSLHPE